MNEIIFINLFLFVSNRQTLHWATFSTKGLFELLIVLPRVRLYSVIRPVITFGKSMGKVGNSRSKTTVVEILDAQSQIVGWLVVYNMSDELIEGLAWRFRGPT